MRKIFHLLFLCSFALNSFSQAPIVNSIEPVQSTIDGVVEISGNNLGTSNISTVVFFGGSKGVIQNIENSFIEVEVPSGVTTSAIQVVNTLSGLSGYSRQLFNLGYGAQDPSAALSFVSQEIVAGKELFDLCACDFDLDGRMDIAASKVTADALDLSIYQNTSNSNVISFVQRNLGTNPELSVASPTLYIKCGDLNGDGKPDLITSRSGSTRNEVFVFRNTGTGQVKFAFKKSIFLDGADFAENLNIRDLDLDGKPEIVVTNTNNNFISIFRNTSSTSSINFDFLPTRIQVTGLNSTNALGVEDLDEDGLPEIVVAPLFESNLVVLKNSSAPGSFSFDQQIELVYDGILNQLQIGDLDRDTKPDIAIVDRASNDLVLFRNTSATGISFQTPTKFTTNGVTNSGWGLSLGDINGNGNLDVIVTSTASDEYVVMKNSSTTGTFAFSAEPRALGFRTRNILNSDFSGDGKPDIAATAFNASGDSFRLIVDRLENCFKPTILNNTTIDLCNGQDLRLEASKGRFVNYIWTQDGTEVKNSSEPFYEVISVTNTDAGVYQVQAVSEGGTCDNLSQTVTVAVTAGDIPGIPTVTNNSPVCPGDDLTFNTETIANVVSYSWEGPDSFTSTDQNPVISNMNTDKAGKYSLIVASATCQSEPITSIVEVAINPVLNIVGDGPTTFCEGDSVNLSVGQISGYSYQWFKDNVAISGATDSQYTAKSVGDYKAEATNITLGCSTESNSLTVSTQPPPTANFSISGSSCVGSSIDFSNTSAVDPLLNISYSWDFGDGSPTSDTENTSHTYTSSGSYAVSLTVSYDDFQCEDVTQQTLVIEDPTDFEILVDGPNPFCQGESVTLSTSLSFVSYTWSTGSTESTISVNAAGTYSVSVINTTGCESSDSINVSVIDLPVIEITAEKNPIQQGESVQLQALGANSWSWQPGESLNDSTIANPVATPAFTTTYSATGMDANGCLGESSITIDVEQGSTLPVVAPKLFSPNGDGVDDTWVINNIDNFPECTITVFTRLGQNVYEALPYNNDWDGTRNGEPLPEGAYFFVITCPDGKSSSGSVSIIR